MNASLRSARGPPADRLVQPLRGVARSFTFCEALQLRATKDGPEETASRRPPERERADAHEPQKPSTPFFMRGVAVYIRAQGDASVVVRVWPTPASLCLQPPPGEPIDVACSDYSRCKEWLNNWMRATSMAQKQRAGRHIRARTVEATVDELSDAIDSMHAMCVRWDLDHRRQPAPDTPLLARLKVNFCRAVHFLCLLRGAISTSRALPLIPAEVWSRIVLEVLPPVSHFAYIHAPPRHHHHGPAAPMVRLAPLPMVPATYAREVAPLLTFQDAERLDELGRAWTGGLSARAAAACGRGGGGGGRAGAGGQVDGELLQHEMEVEGGVEVS